MILRSAAAESEADARQSEPYGPDETGDGDRTARDHDGDDKYRYGREEEDPEREIFAAALCAWMSPAIVSPFFAKSRASSGTSAAKDTREP